MAADVIIEAMLTYLVHHSEPREKRLLNLITQIHMLSLSGILKIEFKMTGKCGQVSFPLLGSNLGFLKVFVSVWD